jgi:hypothetical protein
MVAVCPLSMGLMHLTRVLDMSSMEPVPDADPSSVHTIILPTETHTLDPARGPVVPANVAERQPNEDHGMPHRDGASTPHVWWGGQPKSWVSRWTVRGGLADTCSILGYIERWRRVDLSIDGLLLYAAKAARPNSRTARPWADPRAAGPTNDQIHSMA